MRAKRPDSALRSPSPGVPDSTRTPCIHYRHSMCRRVGVALTPLIIAISVVATACAHSPVQELTRAGEATEPATLDACTSIGDTRDREQCFANLPLPVIDECERLRPGACRPYAVMPLLERELTGVEAAIALASRPTSSEPPSVNENVDSERGGAVGVAADAWREFRDAECVALAEADGMTRSALPDVVQACRESMTRERLKSRREILADLKGERR